MITEVKVPRISANVNEVTITGWFKQEGDTIEKGEALVEMTTDKASFEFESPCSGVVRKTVAEEKSVIPTGYIVALIGEPSDPVHDVSETNDKVIQKYRGAARTKRTVKHESIAKKAKPAARIGATPAARRYAREHGIDLAEVAKKGDTDGVVTLEMAEDFIRSNGKG